MYVVAAHEQLDNPSTPAPRLELLCFLTLQNAILRSHSDHLIGHAHSSLVTARHGWESDSVVLAVGTLGSPSSITVCKPCVHEQRFLHMIFWPTPLY